MFCHVMKFHWLTIIAAVISFFFFHSTSVAQVGEEGPPQMCVAPEGNQANISNDGHYSWTGNTLYDVINHEKDHTTEYRNRWSPPPPRTIVDVESKTVKIDKWGLPDYGHTFILLDNGDIYDVSEAIFFGGIIRYRSHIQITENSEGWKKVVGDDLYSISTSHVYVSRDSGSTWTVDSTGLHNVRVNDLQIDSAQTVYAASDDGLYSQAHTSNNWNKVASFPVSTSLASVFVDNRQWIHVGTYYSGPFVSKDNGTSWIRDTAGVGTIVFSKFGSDSTGTVYAVGPGTQFANFNGSLYKFDNGTASWVRIDAPIFAIAHATVYFLNISTANGLAVGTNFGVFTSSDQGNTWHLNSHGLQAEHLTSLIRTGTGRILATSALGVFAEDPGDTSWNKVYPDSGFSTGGPLFLDNTGVLYTYGNGATVGRSGMSPIIKSSDNGATWEIDTLGLSALRGGVYYVDELGVQHIASSFFGSTDYGLLYSKAPNGSWVLDSTGFTATNYSYGYAIASDHNGYLYASGSYPKMGAVVRRPIGGGTWTVDTAGLSGVTYLNSLTPGRNGDMYGAVNGKLFHRAGGIWTKLNLPSTIQFPSVRCLSVDSTGALVVGFSSFLGVAGVYCTKDDGMTWQHMGLDSLYLYHLISYGDSTYALTASTSWLLSSKLIPISSVQDSVDAGWNLVSVPFTRSNNSVSSLFPDRIAGSTYEYKKGYVNRDTLAPGKGYWTKFASPAADTLRGTALASASVSVDTGWNIIGSVDHTTAAPSGGIITSNVYGYSHGYSVATNLVPGKGYWVKTSGSGTLMLGAGAAPKLQPVRLSDMNSLTIRDAAGNNQTLYFGGASTANPDLFELPPSPPAGTFDARFSTNRMAEFADGNTEREIPIAISAVFPITISWEPSSKQHSSGDLIIGTRTKSLSIAGRVTVGHADDQLRLRIAKAEPQTVPARFALEQAYPNPFNPSTLIRYSIPADDRVTLTVYNILGQEVIKLENADQKSGEYQVRFDGSNIPSGVYFYRLQAGTKADTKKLMLLK